MTRLESGGLTVKLEPTDAGEAVGLAIDRARPLLADHRVDIDLSPELPLVKADLVLLEQVVFNLLDNAAKYTPKGTIIRVAGRAEGDMVVFDVIDEGAGIPAASLEAIFNKFTRLQAEDRTRAGTGLGLPICRGFITAMGGTIAAANRQDRSGAIFTIRLAQAEPVAESLPRVEAHVG